MLSFSIMPTFSVGGGGWGEEGGQVLKERVGSI